MTAEAVAMFPDLALRQGADLEIHSSGSRVSMTLTDRGFMKRTYVTVRRDDYTGRLDIELRHGINEDDVEALLGWVERNRSGPEKPEQWAPDPDRPGALRTYLTRSSGVQQAAGVWMGIWVADLTDRDHSGESSVQDPAVILEQTLYANTQQWWVTVFHELAHIATGAILDEEGANGVARRLRGVRGRSSRSTT